MTLTRRASILGLVATSLATSLGACTGGAARFNRVPEVQPGYRAVPDAAFDAWVAAFRARAKGISPATLNAAFRQAGYVPDVVARDRNQAEFSRSLEDYLAIAASDTRIAKGRAALVTYQATLRAIEARYGVEAQVVAAIWGLESTYGERRGEVPVISALATLAYDGRRGKFFEKQLLAALRILQAGDVTPARMTGSWAGAMGHTQFIPTSYLAYAVDFTGDGRRDIWGDDPSDALASTAAYLARSGWTRGQPWGAEVRLPAAFDQSLAGRKTRRNSRDWAAMGVRDITGGPLADHGAASVLLPAGPGGPAFMAYGNFNVIARYNNSESYVIGVGHLSDRLLGRPAIQGRFPPDAAGMTMDQRKALQQRLTAAGYDTGGSDGVVGAKTRAAISAWQSARGLPVTGQPDLAMLVRLGG